MSERTAPLRRLVSILGRPASSFALFALVLLGWHIPALFDATLSSEALHALEHTLFFCTATMFWKQVIASPPLHARLSPPERVGYVIGAMIVSWVLAVILALAPHALYSHYAHEASRPGGITALADQQIAAGIMWVPGSITFVIVIFAYVHRWLAPGSLPGSGSRLAGEHLGGSMRPAFPDRSSLPDRLDPDARAAAGRPDPRRPLVRARLRGHGER